MVKVAVAGVYGRMGRLARETIESAADLTYVGGFARLARPEERVFDNIDDLLAGAQPQVLVDFTLHPASVAVSTAAIRAGVRPVIGVSGWSDAEVRALVAHCESADLGAMLVPNFSVGAALMMRFAREAARYFPTAEIIEMHHDAKRDAPSGTAKLTAAQMREAGGREPPIHSVRLRGLVAHQEVLLGNTGEILTIRHDSLSRESFAAGIVAAVRRVISLHRLEIGLDAALAESSFE